MSSERMLLREALRQHRRELLAASALYTGHQIGESLVPVIIGAVVDQAIARDGVSHIVLWLGVLAADFLFLSTCFRFGARASMRAKQRTGHGVRMGLTARVVEPAGGADSAPGELLSRASSDANRVGGLAGVLAASVAALSVLIVSTVLLLRFSLVLGAVIMLGTPLLLVLQHRISARLLRRSHVEQERTADATAMAEDFVRGLRVLKGIGAERAASSSYVAASQQSAHASLRAVATSAGQAAISTAVGGVYVAIIAGTGGWLALRGHLSIGALVAALGLAQFLIGPMQTLAAVSPNYARARASAARIAQVLAAPPAVEAGTDVDRPADLSLELDLLDGRGVPTVTVRAEAARITGLLVDDAAVAAQIVALIARERPGAAGQVRLGGRPIERWTLSAWRSTVLVAPHDAAVFTGSVLANIELAGADGSVRESAITAAFVDQLIEALPAGQATSVGDRGTSLSGGQRQRLALARALAADADVLVLADPTTSVDAATEDVIADRLTRLRRGRTTLIITASPALLARCDRVIHLSDVAEPALVGTHAELAQESRDYRQRVSR